MSVTFVVLTNFYPAAQHAVEYAAGLAARIHGRLVLLHVKRASLFDPYLFAGEAWRQAELAAEGPAAEVIQEMVKQLPVPATVEMATDLLPDLAQRLVKQNEPALFVLGRPTPEEATADQVSSAALDLLRSGRFPLLLVPQAAEAAAPTWAMIAADTEPTRLTEPAQVARKLLTQLQIALQVVHVSELQDDDACAEAFQAVKHSGLLAEDSEVTLHCTSHAHLAEGIEQAALSAGAGLLVLLARQRSYLGELFHRSVTAQVLQHSSLPVLVVPVSEVSSAEEEAPAQA